MTLTVRTIRSLCLSLAVLLAASIGLPRTGYPADGPITKNGPDGWRRTIGRSIPAANSMTLVLDHHHGNILIRPGATDRVVLTGEFSVRSDDSEAARTWLEQTRLEIEQNGNRIVITTITPEDFSRSQSSVFTGWLKFFRNGTWNRFFDQRLTYTIEIPPGITLDVTNKYGDVEAGSLAGSAAFRVHHGNTRADHIGGSVRAEGSYGEIRITEIGGDLTATAQHTRITATDVKGIANLGTSYADMKVTSVTGKTTLTNSHGSIQATEIGGALDAMTSYAPVTCRDIRGALTIQNTHGAVRAEKVSQGAMVSTEYADITLDSIEGRVEARGSHGTIRLDGVTGDATVSTNYADIGITGVTGSVVAETDHGTVTLSLGQSTEQHSYKLSSTYGDIRFHAPSTFSARVESQVEYGEITCAFPFTIQGNGVVVEDQKHRLVGVIGGGRDTLSMTTLHGAIVIAKQ